VQLAVQLTVQLAVQLAVLLAVQLAAQLAVQLALQLAAAPKSRLGRGCFGSGWKKEKRNAKNVLGPLLVAMQSSIADGFAAGFATGCAAGCIEGRRRWQRDSVPTSRLEIYMSRTSTKRANTDSPYRPYMMPSTNVITSRDILRARQALARQILDHEGAAERLMVLPAILQDLNSRLASFAYSNVCSATCSGAL
jgi:hypothetical protein